MHLPLFSLIKKDFGCFTLISFFYFIFLSLILLLFLPYSSLICLSESNEDNLSLSSTSSSFYLLSDLSSDFDIPTDEELTGEEKEFFKEESKTGGAIDQNNNTTTSTTITGSSSSSINSSKDSYKEENSSFFMLSIGSTEFRERLGVSSGIQGKGFRFPARINYGKWDIQIADSNSYLYELKASNIGTSMGIDYYIMDLVPIFLHLSIGYSFWRGTITPHVTDSSEFSENFNSKFNLQSINFSLGMGWTYFFKNGLFIQQCIYGIGSGLITKSSFSNSINSKISAATKDKLKHLYGWGLLNIGVGIVF